MKLEVLLILTSKATLKTKYDIDFVILFSSFSLDGIICLLDDNDLDVTYYMFYHFFYFHDFVNDDYNAIL